MRQVLVVLSALAGASGLRAEEFRHDFRKGMPQPSMMILVGPNARKTAIQGPEGLEIKLEPGRKPAGAVGLSPRFGLRGDFDIVLTYELLHVAESTPGFGAGVNLWIGTASSREDEASLGRFSRNEQSVYAVSKSAKDQAGKMRTKAFSFPTGAKKGKLRLERTGATLRYSVSESDAGEFLEVYKTDFARDDVRSVRIAGNTGNQPLALDFRIIDIFIQGDQLIDPDAAKAEASWWKWAAVNGAGLVLLLAIAGWFYRRRRLAALKVLKESPSAADEIGTDTARQDEVPHPRRDIG